MEEFYQNNYRHYQDIFLKNPEHCSGYCWSSGEQTRTNKAWHEFGLCDLSYEQFRELIKNLPPRIIDTDESTDSEEDDWDTEESKRIRQNYRLGKYDDSYLNILNQEYENRQAIWRQNRNIKFKTKQQAKNISNFIDQETRLVIVPIQMGRNVHRVAVAIMPDDDLDNIERLPHDHPLPRNVQLLQDHTAFSHLFPKQFPDVEWLVKNWC